MSAAPRLRRTSGAPAGADLIRLRDSRDLWLRPIHPEDAAPIAGAFALLTEDEIRRRFLHPVKALSEDHLHKLVHPDPEREFVIVAAEPLPPGEALVGAVARVSASPGHDDAEFALLVSHFVAGQGLGKRLLLALIDWSKAHGIRTLWGDVMDDNVAMLRVATQLGFSRNSTLGTPGIVHVSLALPARRRRSARREVNPGNRTP